MKSLTISALAAVVLCGAVPLAAQKQKPSTPRLVRVFVTSPTAEADRANGFVVPPEPDLAELAKQIQKPNGQMKGHVLELATDRDAADLILELQSTVKKGASASDVFFAGPLAFEGSERIVTGVVIVGEARKELTAKTGFNQKVALNYLLAKVEAFARDNRALLTAEK